MSEEEFKSVPHAP